MSQYTDFFIRHNNDFIHIGNYSRSTFIAKYINDDAPYGKIKNILPEQIISIINNIDTDIEDKLRELDKLRHELTLVPTYNNSIQDKKELKEDIEFDIRENEVELAELYTAQGFYMTLDGIIDCAKYSEASIRPDWNKLIYVGIECGEDITEDMIIHIEG